MIDVSAIVVNWNTKELLLQCLESLSSETKRCCLEIILVDNGSTDGSQKAVRETFPNVKLIQNQRNLGFAKANNIGILHSSGRYVCLVNSDIEVLNGCLNKLCNYMDRHPLIGITGPKTLNPDLSLRINCKEFPNLWNTFCRAVGLHRAFPRLSFFSEVLMRYFDHTSVRSVDVLPACFLMVRRESIDKVGMLDENFFFYGEDKDWCKRFKAAGWDVVFYPAAEVIHYAGKSSSVEPVRFEIERLRSNSYYWKKHHGVLAQKSYLLLLILHHAVRLIAGVCGYILKSSDRGRAQQIVLSKRACVRWLILNAFSKNSR